MFVVLACFGTVFVFRPRKDRVCYFKSHLVLVLIRLSQSVVFLFTISSVLNHFEYWSNSRLDNSLAIHPADRFPKQSKSQADKEPRVTLPLVYMICVPLCQNIPTQRVKSCVQPNTGDLLSQAVNGGRTPRTGRVQG